MTRIANSTAREYRSELRAEQVEQTRTRILDATLRVMARGVASVSIPGIAREAGVSVPTVYRHFGSKPDLLAALYPHVVRRAGFDAVVPPTSMADLRAGVRSFFERIDAVDDLARAAMASPAAVDVRALSVPTRVAAVRRIADSIEPPLDPADRDRIARLLAVLVTSSSLGVWRDQLGASVEQAADDIEWIVRAGIAQARRSRA